MKKYIKDGKVAILIADDYGAGWSTCNTEYPEILYDTGIIDLLLNHPKNSDDDLDEMYEKIETICKLKYPDISTLDIDTLEVKWLDVGTKFIITEEDGLEVLQTIDDIKWMTA